MHCPSTLDTPTRFSPLAKLPAKASSPHTRLYWTFSLSVTQAVFSCTYIQWVLPSIPSIPSGYYPPFEREVAFLSGCKISVSRPLRKQLSTIVNNNGLEKQLLVPLKAFGCHHLSPETSSSCRSPNNSSAFHRAPSSFETQRYQPVGHSFGALCFVERPFCIKVVQKTRYSV